MSDDRNAVEKELNTISSYLRLAEASDTISKVISTLETIKSDGLKGFCSDKAIVRDFLTRNLQKLESNKQGLMPIFSSWDWRKYYKMDLCTVALEKENIWVTLRVPMVKKSEKMIRIIPPKEIRHLTRTLLSSGLKTVTFKQIESDQYHIMLEKEYEQCHILGSVRSCNSRSSKFKNLGGIILPVEILFNKFLLIGNTNSSFESTLSCKNLSYKKIHSQSVVSLPNECSLKAKNFEIDKRENDIFTDFEVKLDIKIPEFENITVEVEKSHYKMEKNIQTVNSGFDNIEENIKHELSKIKTEHMNAFTVLQGSLIFGISGLAILMVLLLITICCTKHLCSKNNNILTHKHFTEGEENKETKKNRNKNGGKSSF